MRKTTKPKPIALTWKTAAIVVVALAVGAFAAQWAHAQWTDAQTRAYAEQKITIIEIDDYWNIQDGYFAPYGYSYENYADVLDVIESHGYRATLGAVPQIFNERTRQHYPLANDSRMTAWLKEKQVQGHEIAQHGYTHCLNEQLCKGVEENYENIAKGKKELEALFGPVRTYLPPGNSWNNSQYYNAKVLGFDTVGNTHVPRPYFDGGTLITQRSFDPVSLWQWHAQKFEHYPLQEWVDAYEKEPNVFILQLHSNTFNNAQKTEDLDGFLDYLNQQNATVLTYQDAYRVLRKAKQKEKNKMIPNDR